MVQGGKGGRGMIRPRLAAGEGWAVQSHTYAYAIARGHRQTDRRQDGKAILPLRHPFSLPSDTRSLRRYCKDHRLSNGCNRWLYVYERAHLETMRS